MQDNIHPSARLPYVRTFTQQVLCARGEFEPDAFLLTEQFLHQGGELRAVMFHLHGPRAVKMSAIWDMRRDAVLFYDCTGERFHEATLIRAPNGRKETVN